MRQTRFARMSEARLTHSTMAVTGSLDQQARIPLSVAGHAFSNFPGWEVYSLARQLFT